MTEELTREIIGIANRSKWKKVKTFIISLLKKTLKEDAGYVIVVLDGIVNKKKVSEHNFTINSKREVEKIKLIDQFEHLSLYQYTELTSDHISLSIEDNMIVLLAKYMGVDVNHGKYFDFSIHIDSINSPFFTVGTENRINCAEIVELIQSTENERHEKKNEEEKEEDINYEVQTFESLTGKNAIWRGKETKQFIQWKEKISQKYYEKTECPAYYSGNPTKNFIEYLSSILPKAKKAVKKKQKRKGKESSESNDQKSTTEKDIFERIMGKNAIWRGKETNQFKKWKEKTSKEYYLQTNCPAYYDGKITTNYCDYLCELPEKMRSEDSKRKNSKSKKLKKHVKNSTNKKKVTNVKNEVKNNHNYEAQIFEEISNKKAIWNGKETKSFRKWKNKISEKYRDSTGGYTYYGDKLTSPYKEYLSSFLQ
ncbi:MAG: hypothetical protein GF353_29205 [Candidatus Lokiarchaeota archaeon]|nr:hypothetical protein [Candidatus Lokiarchaeota archaeon]